ncbi:MAG: hypothetical protein ACLSA6_16035 [Holdemania massiliensis]
MLSWRKRGRKINVDVVLFGLYQPTRGTIKVRSQEVKITNPNVANSLGIGMVHQHFKLVECFTVTENIIWAWSRKQSFIRRTSVGAAVQQLSEMYGLNVDHMRNPEYFRGMQQVEILKMLYRTDI